MTTLAMCALAALGLMAGLWWGERGRRIQLERSRGLYRPAFTGKAKVEHEANVEGSQLEPLLDDEQVERMIQDTMAETGCTRKMAEEDVAQMLSAGAIMGMDH